MDDERLARFEAVYRETYGQITAYALRHCDSPQDAPDVVTETFTIAWRRMDDLPSGEEATLWLYGVVRNVVANHHRSEGRRKARSAELDVKMADRYADSPDSRLERDDVEGQPALATHAVPVASLGAALTGPAHLLPASYWMTYTTARVLV